MKEDILKKGTVIRTAFVCLEVIALISISIYAFFAATDDSAWGYWGSLAFIFALLTPIFIYVIPSAIFNTFNLIIVIKKRHTSESIIKYHKLSKVFLIWGVITGALYTVLAPIFLLENIFLYTGYKRELTSAKNTESPSQEWCKGPINLG